ncbi:phage tail protein [Burkholderia ubonensis]|uniref:phage tail protein n=1 Tax=Burkholderia ubonensis TaxID=101571 RepID=UPI00075EC795|nr:phage tail protein [Burkholderia ubonensis]KWN65873.1 phage tail protein [Burkholderia ubonensis]
MATSAAEIAVKYPIPTYRFRVTVGDEVMAFQSASGLKIGFDTIEYKDGMGLYLRFPGQAQVLDITLSRGIVPGQSQLYDWINSTTLNQVDMKDITISLTNEACTKLLLSWTVHDCWPTSLTGPNANAGSNEVALEELTLAGTHATVEWHK